MFDEAKLISIIKNKPCLWNRNEKSYRYTDAKVKAWKEVAKYMYPEWTTCTAEEKNDKLWACRRRWKNMKDSYKKELKRGDEINPQKIIRKGQRYFGRLDFLFPATDPQHMRVTEQTTFEDDSVDEMSDDVDEDEAFFMSILPSVRRLNDRQKLDLRLEILNALQRVQYVNVAKELNNFSRHCNFPVTAVLIPEVSPTSTDSKSDILNFVENEPM